MNSKEILEMAAMGFIILMVSPIVCNIIVGALYLIGKRIHKIKYNRTIRKDVINRLNGVDYDYDKVIDNA